MSKRDLKIVSIVLLSIGVSFGILLYLVQHKFGGHLFLGSMIEPQRGLVRSWLETEFGAKVPWDYTKYEVQQVEQLPSGPVIRFIRVTVKKEDNKEPLTLIWFSDGESGNIQRCLVLKKQIDSTERKVADLLGKNIDDVFDQFTTYIVTQGTPMSVDEWLRAGRYRGGFKVKANPKFIYIGEKPHAPVDSLMRIQLIWEVDENDRILQFWLFLRD